MMEKIKKSKCCIAEIRVSAGLEREGTNYYMCTECGKPCDLVDEESLEAKSFQAKTTDQKKKFFGKSVQVVLLEDALLDHDIAIADGNANAVRVYEGTLNKLQERNKELKKQTMEALDYLETHHDVGPIGEGWQSDELLDLMKRIREK